ncbi:hypothetical protein [Facklamia hominis]|uniref:hypothetical protein n=1 Tax=Facklamia hominis TaxID=178214 RepID=UPI0038FD0783
MPKQMKVAMIPDKTRIIINAGKDQLKKGDHVEIFSKSIDILDPDHTDKILGQYIVVKDTLTITKVYENYSIARKQIEKKTTSLLDIASPMAKGTSYYDYEKINVNPDQNLNINLEDKEIKIGDLVNLI